MADSMAVKITTEVSAVPSAPATSSRAWAWVKAISLGVRISAPSPLESGSIGFITPTVAANAMTTLRDGPILNEGPIALAFHFQGPHNSKHRLSVDVHFVSRYKGKRLLTLQAWRRAPLRFT